jgi:double-stranded uracil-DNA glycosylase
MKHAFNALSTPAATTLILGSMPGEISLERHEYYGHKHNAFWDIMSHITGCAKEAPYAHRCAALQKSRIALWDVLASCKRQGSLDSAIEADSITVNNFTAFFKAHPHIQHVALNGGKAFTLFQQYVVKKKALPKHIHVHKLPSTSPAYASMRPVEKTRLWLKAFT